MRRAHGTAAEILGRSDVPFGGVGEDRPRPFGHRAEVDLGDRERAVADDADVELPAGDVLLHQHFLELLRHGGDAGLEPFAIAHNRLAVETGARVFGSGLDDGGKREIVIDRSLRHRPVRHGQARALEERIGDRFAAARRSRPRAGAGVGNAGKLQRADDVIFPLRDAAHSLTQVEHEVRAAARVEPPHVVANGNPLNLMVERAEDAGDVVDCLHHSRDVLGSPVVRAGIIEDDDLHADAGVTDSCRGTASIRFQAMRVTS